MRGDEESLIAADYQPRLGKGPRHAAPRKSLLTKLQIPAGKAMAIAAMPTAVFVGMGLTPKLALADDKDIPFAPGPCVTRSDEPEESPSASESSKPSDDASEDSSDKPSESPSGDTGDGQEEPKPGESPSASEPADKPDEQSASPSPSETKNPLDPLGVGDALKDLLDGPDAEPTSSAPAPSDTAKPSESAPAESDEPAKDLVSGTVDKTKDAIKDAAEKAGAEVEELDDKVKGLDPVKDEDIPEGADGKPRFPCPTADPEALAAADLEQGIPLLPDAPWRLESTRLTLNGLKYHGIVEVKTGSGKIKKALKFTATSVDIKDLHQLVEGPNGTTAHVKGSPGSTSTIRNGTVTMYTEELKGNLFGLIPVTFSPQTPPPLDVPFAIFTDVKIKQAGQFGGTLTVPGLHNYFTGGNTG
ncbi:hypothetical protein [Streptomyces sp. FIT100]|uniref:hypothetical protein n=1 Tax=Streptomyces sp. FIT100 TaxID=2837956 RepID=UPI0021C8B2E8|nr:hypothetical protein [Streptomyces sp. FIT100]UUN29253.1 hypothetical protein KK483_24885 [Streptomyces sp. FIT100]